MPMSPRLLRPLAAGGFNPSRLSGLISWYDAADLSTLAENADGSGAVTTGTQVGYWADKSPTAAHVTQDNAANRPTYTAASFNGLNAVVFDGDNDTLVNTSFTATHGLSGLTRFIVCSSAVTSNQAVMSDTGAFIHLQLFNTNVFAYRASGNSNRFANGGDFSARVWESVFDGTAGTLPMFYDGVEEAVAVTTGTISGNTGSSGSTLYVGSNNFAAPFNGPLAEAVLYNRTLTAEERSKVRQHLLNKWGLA